MISKRPLQRLRGLFGSESGAEAAPTAAGPPPPHPLPPEPAAGSVGCAAEAARSLGIALSKCSIYGSTHPAAHQAAQNAFAACNALLSGGSGEVEVELERQRLTIHGEPIAEADGQLLAQQMERQRFPGFRLKRPLNLKEFLTFLELLSASTPQLDSKGGMAEALAKARLQSIQRMSTGSQRGPSGGFDPSTSALTRAEEPPTQPGTAARRPHMLDLSSGMTLEEAVQALSSNVEDEPEMPTQMHATAVPMAEPDAARRLEVLLRQLQTLMLSVGTRAVVTPGAGTALVRQLQQGVSTAAAETRTRMEQIAAGVQTDRAVIEALEAEARARGVPLRFSRNELLAQLAEVVQELHQPLTVASGVVDMLLGGTLDAVTPNQAEMLKLASESMTMVAQLAGHLKELVGDPAELTPDAQILRAAYAGGTPSPTA